MKRWRSYLQSLSYSKARVNSPLIGTEYGNVLGVQGEMIFLSPIKSKSFSVGDTFKLKFVNSKLKELDFVTKAIRITDSAVTAKIMSFEMNYTRYALSDLQKL